MGIISKNKFETALHLHLTEEIETTRPLQPCSEKFKNNKMRLCKDHPINSTKDKGWEGTHHPKGPDQEQSWNLGW